MTTSAKSAKEESDRIILRHRDELQSELSAITARALAAEAALEAMRGNIRAKFYPEPVDDYWSHGFNAGLAAALALIEPVPAPPTGSPPAPPHTPPQPHGA